MGNESVDRDFLKQLEPRSFPVFEETCVHLEMHSNTQPSSCKLLLNFYLPYKASKSTRIESLWTSQVFLEHAYSFGHVQGHIHLCGPQISIGMC